MVEFNTQTSEALINLHIMKIVETLSEQEKKSKIECLRDFLVTKTYDLLADPLSYLCLESPAYVLDMLDAERSSNWDRWMEI